VNRGGGVFFDVTVDGVVVNIASSTFEDNTANGDGGGVFIELETNNVGPEVNLTDSTIANNTSINGDGGGMWICPKGPATFNATNSTLSANQALRHSVTPRVSDFALAV